ncbi:MAG: hypothetical protein JWR60_4304 [Polaromonas sp.]|nr:hypothetical protein [Polaromonas sp.]
MKICLRVKTDVRQRQASAAGSLCSLKSAGCSLYNCAVSNRPSTRPFLSAWARLAAFLSFLAVLSALLAPVSLLAEEVRTGKLGGLCSVNTGAGFGADNGAADAEQPGAHCDLCVSLGWAMPPLAVRIVPSFAGHFVAVANFPARVARTIPGLPFSRGPPVLLS